MQLSIDEIILQIRKENKEAIELLFSCFEIHFKVLENKLVNSYRVNGINKEDLRIMMMQDTLNIIKRYEMDKSAFFPYWRTIILRNINNYFEKYAFEFNIEENKVSIDQVFLEMYGKDENTLESYTLHDDYLRYLKLISDTFGEEDGIVLKLWSEGFTYQQIAKMLKIPVSRVGYSVYRSIKYLKNK